MAGASFISCFILHWVKDSDIFKNAKASLFIDDLAKKGPNKNRWELVQV
jgi:hypothetical protein